MKTKKHSTNRILSLVLALVMVVCMLPMNMLTVSAATTTEAYDGIPVTPTKITSSNYLQFGLTDSNYSDYDGWYAIRNSKELYGFANLVNDGNRYISAVLLDDIVINETVSESGAAYSWIPIGYNPNISFMGNFDGNGHSISGLYCKYETSPYIGLFGSMGNAQTTNSTSIKNVVLKNSYICGSNHVGGILGASIGYGALVSNCVVSQDVTVAKSVEYAMPYVGGIVGGFGGLNDSLLNKFSTSCTVSNCVNLGTVQSLVADFKDSNSYLEYIGSIVGSYGLNDNAFIFIVVENCYYLSGQTIDAKRNSLDKSDNLVDFGKGGSIDAYCRRSDDGCVLLSSASDSHSCVSVTHKEIKATCKYTGLSEYSYCLICGTITSGTKEQYPIADHSYSDATCKTLSTCVFCGITKGNLAPGNHEGEITSCTKVDDENHKGVYSCCGIIVTVPHSISGEATCIETKKCTVCLASIGSVDEDNHVSDEKIYSVSVSDRTKHDYKWNCCSLVISTESHSFDENHYCSTCGYTCEHLETNNGVCVNCGVSGVGYVHRYWDSLNNKVVSNNAIASDLISITSSTTAMTDGWYILESDVTVSERITVSGTVNLILADGYTLTANKGIDVSSGNTLNIYGQISETGKIVVSMPSADENYAAIGGGSSQNCGTITISSGTVEATGLRGAAIGSGFNGAEGNITINGGYVTAKNTGSGAAIGSGSNSDGKSAGTVMINGGTVIASNTYYNANYAGAGIGGGYSGDGYTVIINGGNVKATSAKNAIGKGADNSGGSNGTLKDSQGNDVSLSTITLDSVAADTPVTAVEGINNYGLTCVKTLDTNKLYFYLPSGASMPTLITAGGEEYICKSELTYYTEHDWSQKDGECTRCGEVCEHENQTGSTCEICGIALHTHQWEYAVSGTTITATCTADGCTNTDGGSVTLNVADAYYTGGEIGATISGSFTNGATYTLTYNDGSETTPSSIGTHTAKLTVYENGTEKQSVTAQYKISYLQAPNPAYIINGGYQNGTTYWFKSGTSVTLNAPDGYTISTMLNGAYGNDLSFSESDSKVICLKRTSDGALTDAINIEDIRFDGTAATGKITIESRGFWEKLLNKITFGLFFKGDAVAKVEATDIDSGVNSIQCYATDTDLINDAELTDAAAITALETAIGSNWNSYNNEIALNKNAKNIIYVKITDNVGNVTYLSSEGIVLYSDAQAVTESVSTTYKAGADKDVTVELNGNTVKSVANGTTVLTAGTDYTVSADGEITLESAYLDTLNAGTYTFTVSYNPLGMEYVDATGNDAPATTAFNVVIEKADGEVSNINISGKTYDGTAVTAPTFDKLGDGAATIEYKVKDKDDSTYTTTAPKNAGDYVVRVTIAEGTNHKAASATAEFSIEPTDIRDAIVTLDPDTFVYDGQPHKPTVSVVWNNMTLTENTDYIVYYIDNVNASSVNVLGTVYIDGINNFTGRKEDVFEITKREITITAEAKNTVVNTALPTYTYKVEGLVGEDKLVTEPTLTSNADITVIGEYDITATGADAGGNYSIKYVPAKLTVLTDNAVDAAAGYTEELKNYDPATVTSEDKAELDEMLSEINTILADETTTDNGKKALEEVKEQVENLIKKINDAAEATDTENTEKVKDVTAENVTPEDKTDLEKAKDDLEKALEDNGGNYTEDEKKAIEDEIKRIDNALEVIGKVEAVEDKIDKLPENITKNDEAAIKAADDALGALSDYEKSLVDEDAKKALDDAKAALAELNKPADPNSPATSDTSNLWLWVAILFVSGGAVIALTVVDRKKRTASKR